MKNLLYATFIIIGIAIGCYAADFIYSRRHQSHIEQKDHEITLMLKNMKYNEYHDIANDQFGYLIDRIRDSERAGKVVQFGEEEFKVFYYEDSTESYPYHLDGKTFSVYINPKSVFPDHFVMMKTWDFPSQDKYNK